jgi:hypothetical protein
MHTYTDQFLVSKSTKLFILYTKGFWGTRQQGQVYCCPRGRKKYIFSLGINLLVSNNDLAAVDSLLDITGVLAIDGATNRDAGTENLLDGSGEVLGKRSVAENAGNSLAVVQGDVTVVLDCNE